MARDDIGPRRLSSPRAAAFWRAVRARSFAFVRCTLRDRRAGARLITGAGRLLRRLDVALHRSEDQFGPAAVVFMFGNVMTERRKIVFFLRRRRFALRPLIRFGARFLTRLAILFERLTDRFAWLC